MQYYPFPPWKNKVPFSPYPAPPNIWQGMKIGCTAANLFIKFASEQNYGKILDQTVF
jgi:hypothetical protein